MDEETVKKLIKDEIDKAFSFVTKKLGDTPTDAYQLTPKKYVDSKSFSGAVKSDGIKLLPFPMDWTSSKTATGKYTVTHNLNRADYAVVVTVINFAANADNVVYTIPTRGANSFTVEFVQSDSPLIYINTDFNFILAF